MSERIRTSEILSAELVHIGSIVEIQFVDEPDDNIETIQIIDRPGGQERSGGRLPTVSLHSPLGKVILGAKAGDIISYGAPENIVVSIRVVSVK